MNKLTKLEKYWILYDVGNSAFVLLVSTIIPIYFKNLASSAGMSLSDSTAFYSYAISISTLIVAFAGPILGSVGDRKNLRKPIFTFFMMMGVLSLAAMAIPVGWIVFLAIFIIAKTGLSTSLVFYDSMLVDITTNDRVDEVSSHGYAWGYIGSCIPFTISLLLILGANNIGLSTIQAMSIAFIMNALWWLLMTLPLLKNYHQINFTTVKEPVVKNLKKVLINIKNNKKVLYFLIAFFFYIDGVYTIIEMATSYGKDVGIDDNSLLLALLLTQVVAFPFSLIFGKLSKKYSVKTLILTCITGYFFIAVFALWLDTAWKFWVLAVFVAVFQGAIQALSRSYFTQIIPENQASEYFGVFDIFGKGASFMGTLLMGIITQITDSSKYGVIVIAGMFVIGGLIFKSKCVETN
ncbi:MFS transporter [Thomasclavelia sp.]|uniref:MFS transporter n=1 Tax=Thomasclavelia sp. TaxID=3025757 RepID=UPI0025D9720C|nr:MFS transporter [Thomasclavelia sp.]